MTTTETQNLLDLLGIQDLAPDEQEALLLDVGDLIQRGTMVRIIERMDEPTRTAFDELLSTEPSEDEMESFMQQHVPDVDQIVRDTVAELRDDILAVTGASQD